MSIYELTGINNVHHIKHKMSIYEQWLMNVNDVISLDSR